ncbi:MAG: hypothetical protein CM1200mP18_10480 [Gammaproteobacteria bacterium]|nr:MAG: hypothetical protein CM1200mP18_10480 [Gammaproteobacteria bacterium]
MPIGVPAVTSKRDAENPAQQSAGASQRETQRQFEGSEIPEKSDDTSADRGKATDPISEAGIYLTYGHTINPSRLGIRDS